MNIKLINRIIKEIKDSKFNFHGGIDHLETFINSGSQRYWRIGIRIKQDDSDSLPYVLLMYQLRIGSKEFHFSPDSIGFQEDAVNKSIGYAKSQFIGHIENIQFSELPVLENSLNH